MKKELKKKELHHYRREIEGDCDIARVEINIFEWFQIWFVTMHGIMNMFDEVILLNPN